MASSGYPMPPKRDSLVGNLIKALLISSAAGAVGAGVAGPVGMAIGVGGGILGFGIVKAVKHERKWAEYQRQRYLHFKETGEVLPDLQKTERWKRIAKGALGTTAALMAMGIAGFGPAIAAVPALAAAGAVLGASYIATRLAIKGIHRIQDRKYLKDQPDATPQRLPGPGMYTPAIPRPGSYGMAQPAM